MRCMWNELDDEDKEVLRDLIKGMLRRDRIEVIHLSAFATGSGNMGYRWQEEEEIRVLFMIG